MPYIGYGSHSLIQGFWALRLVPAACSRCQHLPLTLPNLVENRNTTVDSENLEHGCRMISDEVHAPIFWLLL